MTCVITTQNFFYEWIVFTGDIAYNVSIVLERMINMNESFPDMIKQFRKRKNFSQQQLADMLFVERSSIANWETGRRLPNAVLLLKIAKCLDIDINILLESIDNTEEKPNIIMVDDESIVLKGGLNLIVKLIPNASVTEFTSPTEALAYAKTNRVHLAFLDIELGKVSGLDLCRELLEINPRTNVIYLTAYSDYALEAWDTGACGYAMKPISAEQLRDKLSRLRFPVRGLQI